MSGRRPRLPGRLLLRIYLVGLAQLLLIAFAFTLARRYVNEGGPRPHFYERNAAYFVSEWARFRDQPEELQGALDRAGQQLRLRVTMRAVDGRLLASNLPRPREPLSAEELQQLETDRMESSPEPPHTIVVGIPEKGPLEAYALMETPPPPGPPPDLWIMLAVVLGCTAITSIVFARSLAVPLQQLAAAARALGSGNLGARTGVRRRDELGQVAEAFDEMAERVTYLLRSQKELLANVSHELRTPLARIRVALDLANEGSAELARESLGDIAEDLGELERLISDVLTAARLDLATEQTPGATPPLRREHVEAQSLLDKAATRFRSARPEHRLDVRVEGALPALEADPVLLRRAFDNLLDNAGKYSEPHTTVRLLARPLDNGLQVEVRDEGIGIDANDLPHLFTPFFRSDRSRARKTGGVGLGLALARRIVIAHGGTLTLESQPGQGTTARVILPAAPPAGQAAEQANVARHLS
ncbi:cell wall metabolism sensor histidine kinase WalK [Vitiosangium sp. GDMCC 1.1324]|uniref:sensor histidine kinase n=1 Tax=Vitiosangium sp. (strain GDMCC 1.1324) TaxID=2138576 RepID=UPI000D3B5DBA|nr:HAMP domain-containing sensor histidine kinase [Vitiosangium sp. GDMCC 1.1324]PTL84186.1 sensor histidine kinase [Vitiosangium sp. GDMCC 1.1324]